MGSHFARSLATKPTGCVVRDFHYGDLAHPHQHGSRRSPNSPRLQQRRSGVAAYQVGVFLEDFGIGFFIWNAYQNGQVSEIILALVYIGLVGWLLDKLVAWVQTLILPEGQH